VSHTPAHRFNRRPIAKAKSLRFDAAMSQRLHVAVHDNPQRHRFEADVDGAISFAEYQLGPGTITFTHTLVPEPLRHRGIGTQLVQAGLAAAQAQRRGVIPQCSMFSEYMRQRPDTHPLLAPAGRALLRM
jgi:hypothetical protein